MPKSHPSGLSSTFGPCEKSRSETLPAHLGSVLGSHDPGQMGIMTSSESAHLYRVKTDISAVLSVMSGLDSHMIRT